MENETYKTQCETLIRIEEDGTRVTKPKKKFETHDDAVATCKRLNAMPNRINKVVTYKCNVCHKYHIGRNGKIIKDKYRNKLNNNIKRNYEDHNAKDSRFEKGKFKVIGKIDLSKIPKK